MFKFKFKALFVSLIGALLACLLFVNLMTANIVTFAEEIGQNDEQEKIICTATIEDNFADDSVIVVLDSEISEINKVHSAEFFNGIDIARIKDLTVRKYNLTNEDNTFKQILKIYLKDSSKEKVLKSIAKLEKIGGVYSASPNYKFESTMVPNDEYYLDGSQWNLNGTAGINIEGAWNYTQGSKNIRVGIIDSGIAPHTDLNDNLVAGYNFYDNNTNTDDVFGHGTNIAGVIGAQGNNGIGVAGINWHVSLVPLKCTYVIGARSEYDNDSMIRAINWATDLWGTSEQIDILNFSVSGFGKDSALAAAIAGYKGLFVCSAGNVGKNVDTYEYIDNFNLDNLISVGAIDKNNERSIWTTTSSSSYGHKVNIFAPGGRSDPKVYPERNIPTTHINNNYSAFDGTSCAAPHVAGVAALMLSLNRNVSAKLIKKFILENADSIDITVPTGVGGTTKQTVKKLNAYKAVSALNRYLESNRNKSFYYVVDQIHATQSSATTLDKPILNMNDSYTYTAPESMTYSNDVRNFTEWRMILNGPNAYDSVKNPWITFSSDRTLSFSVLRIISHYYPDYEVTDTIYFRAIYKTSPPSSCLAEDSLITLADGSQKLVKDLTGEESLLVWNLFTGTLDTAPILCIDSEPLALNEVINLYFSDGTTVKVISEHGFYDLNLNKYVYLKNDASQYVGHWFVKQDTVNDEKYTAKVQLTDVIIQEEYTTAWSPVTYGHLCYFVNGMLSMPGGLDGLFNIFTVDSETLKYDEASYLQDIETYGLYSYEEFNDILPVSEELFKAVNGQYLKVAIGKSIIDFDILADYVERYARLFE